jgi:hypothetical protein
MKINSLRSILCVVLLALFAMPAFALDDHKNAGTAFVYEDDFIVMFYGTQAPTGMNPDSTTNWYTKAFYIGDCNAGHAFVGAVTSEYAATAVTIDVNVYIEHALYLGGSESWLAGPVASGIVLDQLTGTTVQNDTLDNYGPAGATESVIHNRFYNTMPWMRLKFDGQTGNAKNAVVSWWVSFTKKTPGSARLGNRRIQSTTN